MGNGTWLALLIVLSVLGLAGAVERWLDVPNMQLELRCLGCQRRQRKIRGLQLLLILGGFVAVASLMWGLARQP